MPINCLMSATLVGSGMDLMASTFSGSGRTPDASTIWPRNRMMCFENSHLTRVSVTFVCSSLSKTASTRRSCSSWFHPCISMSSLMQTTPSRPPRMSDIRFRKYSGAEPKGRRLKVKLADWCNEMVRRADSAESTTCLCWHPALKRPLHH